MSILNEVTRGHVMEIFRDDSTDRLEFEWRITGCPQLREGFYASPILKYLNTNWILGIHKARHNLIHVHLRREPSPIEVWESVRFTIRCKTPGVLEEVVARDKTLPKNEMMNSYYIPASIYCPRQFTFHCTMRKEDSPHAEGVSLETRTEGVSCSNGRKDELVNLVSKGVSRETQTEVDDCRNDKHRLEVLSSLSEHLKNLLVSGDDHDVLIKVKDKQFRAHKNILKARSPVFAAMFKNEMAESAEGSITIEDCDPDAFGEFLQFVYSGAVDIASASSALGLYYAGDKYDFPRLKDICVQFLKNSFTTATVFDVINLAARHDEEELMQQAIVYFANNLEEVLLTVEWQRFLSANPIQANEMNLKAVQCLKTSLYKK